MGDPQNGWFLMENPIKLDGKSQKKMMIWGYHHFRQPPYLSTRSKTVYLPFWPIHFIYSEIFVLCPKVFLAKSHIWLEPKKNVRLFPVPSTEWSTEYWVWLKMGCPRIQCSIIISQIIMHFFAVHPIFRHNQISWYCLICAGYISFYHHCSPIVSIYPSHSLLVLSGTQWYPATHLLQQPFSTRPHCGWREPGWEDGGWKHKAISLQSDPWQYYWKNSSDR